MSAGTATPEEEPVTPLPARLEFTDVHDSEVNRVFIAMMSTEDNADIARAIPVALATKDPVPADEDTRPANGPTRPMIGDTVEDCPKCDPCDCPIDDPLADLARAILDGRVSFDLREGKRLFIEVAPEDEQ